MTIYSFRVEGRGEFPFDMLRYDECYPDGPDDAARLPYPTDQYGERVRLHDTVRRIKLLSNKMPTHSRWASYGWEMMEFMGHPVAADVPL